jgi:hypothetical protein
VFFLNVRPKLETSATVYARRIAVYGLIAYLSVLAYLPFVFSGTLFEKTMKIGALLGAGAFLVNIPTFRWNAYTWPQTVVGRLMMIDFCMAATIGMIVYAAWIGAGLISTVTLIGISTIVLAAISWSIGMGAFFPFAFHLPNFTWGFTWKGLLSYVCFGFVTVHGYLPSPYYPRWQTRLRYNAIRYANRWLYLFTGTVHVIEFKQR